ncbi:arginase [Penicillium coprophilum]|uniref:arginase n=1 Tax=Penicillium coprophilum TaxID=36646 RepID=UPI00238EA407|nr:arginase [Penicillium coprophilum]KAJ5174081.1 arginase [Penicillium coprophilum]
MRFLVDRSKLTVVVAKFSCGAPRAGAEKGPQAIIDTGVFSDIRTRTNIALDFVELSQDDQGSQIPSDTDVMGMKKPREVSAASAHISSSVYQQARLGRFVVTLGGDHSIGVGTVSGTAKAIDAHADINRPETSLSGRIHGMPVAFVSGMAKSPKKGIFDWLEQNHLINLRKFVYIGLRDVDEAEQETIAKTGIKAFTMKDVQRYGVEKVMDLALSHIGSQTPIHASYDIDSLDPKWAPSTGFPVASGLSLDEGVVIAKRLHESGNLIALDLVEINPDIATSHLNVTLNAGCKLIKNALGVVDCP